MVRIKILFPKEEQDSFEVEDKIFNYEDDGFTAGIAPRNVLDPVVAPPQDIPVVSFYKDDCNAAVSFRANIGGYQLPGYDIIHRFSECRNEAEYSPPDYEKKEEVQIPPDDELVHIIVRAEEYYYNQGTRRNHQDLPQGWVRNKKEREIITSEIPCKEQLIIKSRRNPSIERLAYAKLEIQETESFEMNGSYFGQYFYPGGDLDAILSRMESDGFDINLDDGAFGTSTTYKLITKSNSTEYFLPSEIGINNFRIFYGYPHELKAHLDQLNIINVDDVITDNIIYQSRDQKRFPVHVPGDVPGDISISSIDNDFYGLLYTGVGTGLNIVHTKDKFKIYPGNFNGKFIPPAPPPPDMSCCPDYSDLFKVLLKKVDKLSQIVGVDEYPASLPKSLITENGKNQGNEQITNLTRLLEWYIKRFDELMGQFEIAIDIDDTDLTKEGKQKQTIRLPNLSETLAEMVSLMVQSSIVKQAKLGLIAVLGTTIGAAVAEVFCGAIPGAIIISLNEPLAQYVLKELGEQALAEMTGHLTSLVQATFQTTKIAAFSFLYKNARQAWRGSDADLKSRLKKNGVSAKDIEKALNDRNKPWSFALSVQEKLDGAPGEGRKILLESAYNQFGSTCLEAGYAIVGAVDAFYAQQANSADGDTIEVDFTDVDKPVAKVVKPDKKD